MSSDIYSSPDYWKARREREAALDLKEQERQAMQAENETIHQKYLDRLKQEETERAATLKAERSQEQAAQEAELKKRARASWSGTDASFEAAWPTIVAGLVQQERQEYQEKVRARHALDI